MIPVAVLLRPAVRQVAAVRVLEAPAVVVLDPSALRPEGEAGKVLLVVLQPYADIVVPFREVLGEVRVDPGDAGAVRHGRSPVGAAEGGGGQGLFARVEDREAHLQVSGGPAVGVPHGRPEGQPVAGDRVRRGDAGADRAGIRVHGLLAALIVELALVAHGDGADLLLGDDLVLAGEHLLVQKRELALELEAGGALHHEVRQRVAVLVRDRQHDVGAGVVGHVGIGIGAGQRGVADHVVAVGVSAGVRRHGEDQIAHAVVRGLVVDGDRLFGLHGDLFLNGLLRSGLFLNGFLRGFLRGRLLGGRLVQHDLLCRLALRESRGREQRQAHHQREQQREDTMRFVHMLSPFKYHSLFHCAADGAAPPPRR